MGRLKGICISEKRGTEKHEVREAMDKMDWGKQHVFLLSGEQMKRFRNFVQKGQKLRMVHLVKI